jgi:aspartate aminotransferase-like enzyme
VTSFLPPEGSTAKDIIREMRERHGIDVQGGQAAYADAIVRIGHMGWVDRDDIEITIEALGTVTEILRDQTSVHA